MMTIRPATAEDLERFYGAPPAQTMQALVADLDGELLAVGGVMRTADALVAFSDMKPGMRRHKKDIVRGAREIMRLVHASRAPVLAVADRNEAGAGNLLQRFGFRPAGTSRGAAVYRIEGGAA
jgi:hypothetical protein